jgi:hypothetical protein
MFRPLVTVDLGISLRDVRLADNALSPALQATRLI